MVAMAIQSQVSLRESVERKPWTSDDRREVLLFLAESFGLVCAALFLYSLGPGVGITLIAVSLAAWSLLRSRIASEGEGDGLGKDVRHATAEG